MVVKLSLVVQGLANNRWTNVTQEIRW